MKVVIVGGVAGGATAAARIRRMDDSAQIVVFERSSFVSYANCGLPYYIGGVITDKRDLTLQSPDGFRERFRIDVRVRHEVTAIDVDAKTVTVRGLDTGETYTETYDKLLLSPGARPTVPDVPGKDLPGVFTLRTVEDTFRIREYVEENAPKSAVIAGGGFIGLEMAENLTAAGVRVTLLQRPKQVLPPLDGDIAAFLHAHIREKGVDLRLGCALESIEKDGQALAVRASGTELVRADMVVLALGVTPDSKLARDAGLRLGAKDSIAVNDRMETSAPDVYAVGDAVEITHFVSGAKALVPLAGPANKQGRIAADNICGLDRRYTGAQGSSVVRVFDMTAAATGLNEKTAAAAGIDYDKIVISPTSHASYYPGANRMVMKVLYEKGTLRLLGANAAGYDGVDKRMDVLAGAIRAGQSALDLRDLELCYAPPYSSAKDPVNMAGYVIENIVEGRIKQYHWHDVAGLPRDGSVTLLDVRTPGEYKGGCAEGFINIPVDELRDRVSELDPGKPVYVMCQGGIRSYYACRFLAQNGFDCYNFSGGYMFYSAVTEDRALRESAMPCGMER